MTITLLWYHVPALLSVLAICLALFWPSERDTGMFAGVFMLLRLLPAFIFIAVVWFIAAVLK